MESREKRQQLSDRICNVLLPLVGQKCVYLDLPYYENVGDVLIWEGTEAFLKKCHISIVCKASWDTFDFRDIDPNVPILLQGGGNFGDVWFPPQDFRRRVISHYPNNRIIILPQTVYYEKEENLKKDAVLFAQHKNLIICARDKFSYSLVQKYFSNQAICLPDMAFCIEPDQLSKWLLPVQIGSELFVRRDDVELGRIDYSKYVPASAHIADWPTYNINILYRLHWLLKRRKKLERWHLMWVIDLYAQYYLRPKVLRMGIGFISRYEHIYTTRLHVAILSVLLNKTFVLFDNSYGKNRQFYETWLSDLDTCHCIDHHE